MEQNLQSEKTIKQIAAEVPVHLQEVFKSAVEHLDSQQSEQLVKVQSNFADAFAINDFYLGYFTVIEHAIDTGMQNQLSNTCEELRHVLLMKKVRI